MLAENWSTHSTRDLRLLWDEDPTFKSATLDGVSLKLTFSEPLDSAKVPAASAFDVEVGGTDATLASSGPVAISDRTVTLTLATAPAADATVTVKYTKPSSNPLSDVQGYPVATFGSAESVTRTGAKLTLVVNAVATDNVINIAEKASGFTVSGDTGTEAGVSVVVQVGTKTFDAVTSSIEEGETNATWSVSVPMAATYITGTSVALAVNASKTGFTASDAVERSLTVDLTAPTAPTYTAPTSLKVGEELTAFSPTGLRRRELRSDGVTGGVDDRQHHGGDQRHADDCKREHGGGEGDGEGRGREPGVGGCDIPGGSEGRPDADGLRIQQRFDHVR